MLDAKLIIVGGDTKTKEIRLKKFPMTLGRARTATVTLPHPLVSRKHCEIYESDGQLIVRDLGSLNGTFGGNQRITEQVLRPGELLTIGTVTFRAAYGEPHDTSSETEEPDTVLGSGGDTDTPGKRLESVSAEQTEQMDPPAVSDTDETDSAPSVADGERKTDQIRIDVDVSQPVHGRTRSDSETVSDDDSQLRSCLNDFT